MVPPDWWADPDQLPDWMFYALSDAQQTISNLSKWQLCIRWLEVTATTQHVALVLSTYMDTTTLKAFPSVATLARDTSRKRTTVRDALRSLEMMGWLEIERYRNSRGDERISNRYYGRFPDQDVDIIRAGGNGKVVGLWANPFN
jgi:hypothetical protein